MRYESPGTYTMEVPSSPPPIEGVALTLTAFVGATTGSQDPDLVRSVAEFAHRWPSDTPLATAVAEYFGNGGTRAWVLPVAGLAPKPVRRALADLDPDVALVAIPADPAAPPAVVAAASDVLRSHGAMLLLDGPWTDVDDAVAGMADPAASLGAEGPDTAVYWPRLRRPRPGGGVEDVSPLGAVAGVIAQCEDSHGVDKTPAGATARIVDVTGPAVMVDDHDMDALNEVHINVIRRFPGLGTVVWGARTLSSDPEWKYVPVRRTALYLERSIRRGLQWTVFEPDDERLWARVRENVGDFLEEMFRAGVLEGPRHDAAYFVRCDRTTMTQSDIDVGRVIVEVGFAPLRPAEFIVLRIEAEAAGAR